MTGQVAAGGEDAHVFGARAGQAAVVHFEGPADSYWTLVGPDGSPLHTGATEQQEDATVALPRTGDYVLDVHSATAGSLELDLTIPPADPLHLRRHLAHRPGRRLRLAG